MLNAALKEMNIQSGTVDAVGSIVYAAQQPWIFGSTVRQNILFGNEFDADRYKKVIEACALVQVGCVFILITYLKPVKELIFYNSNNVLKTSILFIFKEVNVCISC